MANMLASNQTTTTTAPSYYNDYLATLATQGGQAAQNAQFVGPTDLQNQAFSGVTPASTAYQPTLTEAGNALTSAVNTTSPLAAGAQYLQSATQSPAQMAQSYMSPYINSVVNSIGDQNARQIQQNLAPLATAGAVASGQAGSQRANQVLGQTINNADQNALNQQYQALNTGYNTALQTAEQQNALLGQLGSTAGTQAYQGQTGLTNAGQQLGNLAQTNQNLGLGAINAQDTLGTQQQTIAQNQQNYPLTKLQALAGLMSGQSIPTTSATTLNASPLSGIATVGAIGAGLANSGLGSTLSKGASSLYDKVTGAPTTPTVTDASGNSLVGATPSITSSNLQNLNNAGGMNDYIPGYGTAPTNPGATSTEESPLSSSTTPQTVTNNSGSQVKIVPDGFGGYVNSATGQPTDSSGNTTSNSDNTNAP